MYKYSVLRTLLCKVDGAAVSRRLGDVGDAPAGRIAKSPGSLKVSHRARTQCSWRGRRQKELRIRSTEYQVSNLWLIRTGKGTRDAKGMRRLCDQAFQHRSSVASRPATSIVLVATYHQAPARHVLRFGRPHLTLGYS